jgi:transposase
MEGVIGIDVAKATLAVSVLKGEQVQSQEFSNEASGFKALEKWLEQQEVVGMAVGMEATGRYWEAVATHLYEAGYQVHVINPAQISAFRKTLLKRTKTDREDATLIARFCRQCQPKVWQPHSPAVHELQSLLHHYDSLMEERKRLKNRLQVQNSSTFVLTQLQDQLDFLERQLDALKQQIDSHVDQEPPLRAASDLIDSIPGIAPLTAAKILAEIGDASQFASADQLATYAGLCPANFVSGTSVHAHPRMSKTGNKHLRKALYMPALSAINHNPRVAPLAQRLHLKGKPRKEIVGAAMHKLIRLVFGVLHSKQPFYPLPA